MTKSPSGTPPGDRPDPPGGRARKRLEEFERDRKVQPESGAAPPAAPEPVPAPVPIPPSGGSKR